MANAKLTALPAHADAAGADVVYGAKANVSGRFTVTQLRDGLAATSHTHAISDVTNLQTNLDGKAAASHTHAISAVTDLQATLDGKQPLNAGLTALGALSTTGVVRRTGANTFTAAALPVAQIDATDMTIGHVLTVTGSGIAAQEPGAVDLTGYALATYVDHRSGADAPTVSARYVGDTWVRTSNNTVYVANGPTIGAGAADWSLRSTLTGANGNFVVMGADNVPTTETPAEARVSLGLSASALFFTIDGGGDVIPTGVVGDIVVPVACTITRVTALADQSGSAVVDIWKETYANYPAENAESITSSAPITLSTAIKAQDATLTGWTTALAAGDTLRFNVDSATTIERLSITIEVAR